MVFPLAVLNFLILLAGFLFLHVKFYFPLWPLNVFCFFLSFPPFFASIRGTDPAKPRCHMVAKIKSIIFSLIYGHIVR